MARRRSDGLFRDGRIDHAGRLIAGRGAIALRLKICHNILDLSPWEGILLMRGNVPVFVARSDSRHIRF